MGHVGAPSRVLGRVRTVLNLRPLAEDDGPVDVWARHVYVGVIASELAAIIAVLYVVLADRPARSLLLSVAAAVMLLTPLAFLLPIERIARSPYGSLFFFGWSLSNLGAMFGGALIDGGATSAIVFMLFLPLTFAGLVYRPGGVAVLGLLSAASYVGLTQVGAPPSAGTALLMTGTFLHFTLLSTWTSINQWRVLDEQLELAHRLRVLASVDQLTGCVNRTAFHPLLAAHVARASLDSPLTVCVLDLDGFKQVNDTHGHASGDQVLVQVAEALRAAARPQDVVARLGGDEFALLLPDAGGREAAQLVARLVDGVRTAARAHGVTASVGTATLHAPDPDVDRLLDEADRAMYAVKTAGRSDRRAVPRQVVADCDPVGRA